MNIDFKSNKLRKCCNNYADGVREWGDKIAFKVMQRLNELRAAHDLSEISSLPPPRLQSVGGIRANCWAVDIIHPMRLLFIINQTPIPLLPDGGIDKFKVTDIKIMEVEDYHGKQRK